jgi:hypothetical protein
MLDIGDMLYNPLLSPRLLVLGSGVELRLD